NFNYPYISASVTEFWRRWHISLGSWFRDYVYIPLGGNKRGKARQLFNILVVWFLTGMWHGAAWNFIIWGLFFAVFLTVEKLWLLKHLERSKVLSRVYVLILVLISFVIFNASSMAEAGADLAGLIGIGENGMIPIISSEAVYSLKSFAVVMIIAVIGATPLPKKLAEKFANGKNTKSVCNVCEPVVLMALMLVMTAYLVDGSFNPFLYFRF
ncbi:MAG: MBOAT family protein, partial [Oscillospiraceae bacterium]|nr:MBOAT family protein [Oscillospiraceae bacterium]